MPNRWTPDDDDVSRMDGCRRRWYRLPKVIVPVVLVLLFGSGALTWVLTSTHITGTVSCTSGNVVSGVWVEGTVLGHVGPIGVNSGFAKVTRAPDKTTFSWERHLWGGQDFHVGCGYIPNSNGQWRAVGYSKQSTTFTRVAIVCRDAISPAPNGSHFCDVTELT